MLFGFYSPRAALGPQVLGCRACVALACCRAWLAESSAEHVVLVQARALFEAPPGAPHLLPFYSRVAASLTQVFPDVASALLRFLEEEFAQLQVCTRAVCMHACCLRTRFPLMAHTG